MWENLSAANANKWDRRREEEAAKQAYKEQLIKSKGDFNDQAQVGFFDKLAPWDTYNERADALNRELMTLQSGDADMANEYYDAEGVTSMGKVYDWAAGGGNTSYNAPAPGETVNNASTGAYNMGKNLREGADDLMSKYFGGGTSPQPAVAPAQNLVNLQQTQNNSLPSSLAKPDNISSFMEYLKNQK